jgi:hypothetical protein
VSGLLLPSSPLGGALSLSRGSCLSSGAEVGRQLDVFGVPHSLQCVKQMSSYCPSSSPCHPKLL